MEVLWIVLAIFFLIGCYTEIKEARAKNEYTKALKEQNDLLWKLYMEWNMAAKELIRLRTEKDGGNKDEEIN